MESRFKSDPTWEPEEPDRWEPKPTQTTLYVGSWMLDDTFEHPGPRINIRIETHYPKSGRTRRDGILLSIEDAERLRDDLDARIRRARPEQR